MFFLEIIAMKVEGPTAYFSDPWNFMDLTIFPTYLLFVYIQIQSPESRVAENMLGIYDGTDHKDYMRSVHTSGHEQSVVLLNAFILISVMFKTLYFMKIYATLGLMSALLLGVFKAVVPFLGIFFMFVAFFATMAYILCSNKSNAHGFKGVALGIGYFL